MTPLEAFEKLTNYGCSKMSEKIECKEIIKNALNRLEELDLRVIENNLLIDTLQKVIKKQEQVLKIIKEKKIAVDLFIQFCDCAGATTKDIVRWYNSKIKLIAYSNLDYRYEHRMINEKDCDLLKEYLK